MEGDKPQHKKEISDKINFDNMGVHFALFSLVFLVSGILASALFLNSSPPPSWEFGEESVSLQKTANLSFDAGEVYVYNLTFTNQSQTISLKTKYASFCPSIVFEDSNNSYMLCLRQSGFYSNSSQYLGELSFPFYAPWMLYITDDFSWKPNRTVSVYPANITQRAQLHFKLENKTSLFGRDVFEVSAKKISSPPVLQDDFFSNTTFFVDAQKRILIYAQSSQAQITLISAPFEPKSQ